MIKKHQIALYLDKSEEQDGTGYTRIKKSTVLTIAVNPQTEEYDYIADEFPTTELTRYNPTIEQDLTMIKGEADYDMIFDAFYNLKVGNDAKMKCLIVFMAEGQASAYKAWQTTATIIINDLNAVDSKINFNIAFGGDTQRGTANLSSGTPTFSPSVEV